MNRVETGLPGVWILEPRVFPDRRGFFFESYNDRTLAELGIADRFVQDNHSQSSRGTLRGHVDTVHPNLPGIGCHQPRHHAQQRGLARAVGTEQPADAAIRRRPAQNVDRLHRTRRVAAAQHEAA